MAHWAKVCDGKVVQIIVAEAEFFSTFSDTTPGQWIQTSYNTRGNRHYDPLTGDEDSDINQPVRGNYAAQGYHYDPVNDVFYPPQPYPSWTLDRETWLWAPPVPYPSDGKFHAWDEDSLSWKTVI